MNNNMDNFLKSKGAKERGIIDCYLQRENRYHTAQSALLKCVTVREDGKGKFVPAFTDAVSEHVEEFREAEASARTVAADIQEILTILGEFATVSEMGEALRRARLTLGAAERDLRVSIAKASISEGEKALESTAVIEASLKRDRIRDETEPVITDLEKRSAAINAILERY